MEPKRRTCFRSRILYFGKRTDSVHLGNCTIVSSSRLSPTASFRIHMSHQDPSGDQTWPVRMFRRPPRPLLWGAPRDHATRRVIRMSRLSSPTQSSPSRARNKSARPPRRAGPRSRSKRSAVLRRGRPLAYMRQPPQGDAAPDPAALASSSSRCNRRRQGGIVISNLVGSAPAAIGRVLSGGLSCVLFWSQSAPLSLVGSRSRLFSDKTKVFSWR